ncbi:hypothetical protein [Tepidibacter hydrothermalis]|uniref:Uncharacterized protein n=1 Tax=Tepidibacter hydrothermalis TaxID=3036126 RepID=A0ABY8EIS3_9FIRM|nr:hypothetical protein [Tepidibacter hydrothermalis]WFD10845.1 hypothetical protein P4S50_01850 [Tepidibacter hydrothermalis]
MNNREKNSETLCWILGFNYEAKSKVRKYVKESGMKSFLLSYKTLEFTLEEKEKIGILKRVLETFDGDIETIDFGEDDDY